MAPRFAAGCSPLADSTAVESAAMSAPAPRRPAIVWLLAVFVAGCALTVGTGLLLRGRSPAPFPRAPVAPFGQLELDRGELPASGLIPIALALAEPSANADPLPAQVFSTTSDRMLEMKARLDDARTVATIE